MCLPGISSTHKSLVQNTIFTMWFAVILLPHIELAIFSRRRAIRHFPLYSGLSNSHCTFVNKNEHLTFSIHIHDIISAINGVNKPFPCCVWQCALISRLFECDWSQFNIWKAQITQRERRWAPHIHRRKNSKPHIPMVIIFHREMRWMALSNCTNAEQ